MFLGPSTASKSQLFSCCVRRTRPTTAVSRRRAVLSRFYQIQRERRPRRCVTHRASCSTWPVGQLNNLKRPASSPTPREREKERAVCSERRYLCRAKQRGLETSRQINERAPRATRARLSLSPHSLSFFLSPPASLSFPLHCSFECIFFLPFSRARKQPTQKGTASEAQSGRRLASGSVDTQPRFFIVLFRRARVHTDGWEFDVFRIRDRATCENNTAGRRTTACEGERARSPCKTPQETMRLPPSRCGPMCAIRF